MMETNSTGLFRSVVRRYQQLAAHHALDRSDRSLVPLGVVGNTVGEANQSDADELNHDEPIGLGDLTIGDTDVDQSNEETVTPLGICPKGNVDLRVSAHVGPNDANKCGKRRILSVQFVRRVEDRVELVEKAVHTLDRLAGR